MIFQSSLSITSCGEYSFSPTHAASTSRHPAEHRDSVEFSTLGHGVTTDSLFILPKYVRVFVLLFRSANSMWVEVLWSLPHQHHHRLQATFFAIWQLPIEQQYQLVLRLESSIRKTNKSPSRASVLFVPRKTWNIRISSCATTSRVGRISTIISNTKPCLHQ